MEAQPKLLKSKMFWVAILYFAEGFPLGIFYEIFPVYFRDQHHIELKQIGIISLLGLAWTLKFLWAPAIDHYRNHRLWMVAADLLMGALMLYFAMQAGFGPWVWVVIGLFTLLSATNDIAIDGYTIDFLEPKEYGLANGLRIGFYRVGMLASGFILMLTEYLEWRGAFIATTVVFVACAAACLLAPKERARIRQGTLTLGKELRAIFSQPGAFAAILLFILATLWLINRETKWSTTFPNFWSIAFGIAGVLMLINLGINNLRPKQDSPTASTKLTEGPMFGALLEMLQRPYIVPVILFVLIFKLGDSAMGFMVKPFWVDAGFTPAQIGLVSVNIGLGLSIAGGIAGGWFTDKVGIFRSLWILGLFQALSNLVYAFTAHMIPLVPKGTEILFEHKIMMYSASAFESFTGGLGTAAFLAFLMAIVNKKHSATEYALLSSVFALSRSFSGWASGYGAQAMGYAPYFLLTFFLAFPAYLLLPWVKKMLGYAQEQQAAVEENKNPSEQA